MIKLLLVEDDANLAYMEKNSLEEIVGGYEVRTAGNGKEGLKAYAEFKPDVIVSDIKMPEMDGLEMVKRIRETDGDTVILFTTAHLVGRPEGGLSRRCQQLHKEAVYAR